MLYRLPEPYSLLSIASVLFLVPTVRAVRELASEAALSEAAGWHLRHTLLVLAGVPFFLLVVFGMSMPDDAAQ
jgi:hypothetical protein